MRWNRTDADVVNALIFLSRLIREVNTEVSLSAQNAESRSTDICGVGIKTMPPMMQSKSGIRRCRRKRERMKTDELKPVPCGCGGEAKVITCAFGNAKMVLCGRCGMRTVQTTEAEAITAWNRAMGGVVTYPCTTVDGVYTSGCTITNTSSPNEDFHPVRDCMVGAERTAKVIEHDASVTVTDGYKYHRSEYLCGACKKKVIGGDDYCSHCGARLEWE